MENKDDIEQEAIARELIERAEAVKLGIHSFIVVLINTIKKQRDKASILGISTFNSQTLIPELEEYLTRIEQSIEETKQKVAKNQSGVEYEKLLTLLENYKLAGKILLGELDRLSSYQENSKKDLKRTLDSKVQNIIYKTEYDRLSKEKRFLIYKPETFMDRILGKTRLREARIRNIDARMKRAEARKKTVNPIRRVEDMLKDLYEYVEDFNNGILTEEMQRIEAAIRKNFDRVKPRNEIMSEEADNHKRGLQVSTVKRRKLFWLKNWREAKRLDEETNELNQEEQGVSSNKEENYHQKLTEIYGEIKKTLSCIESLVASKEGELTIERSAVVPEQ